MLEDIVSFSARLSRLVWNPRMALAAEIARQRFSACLSRLVWNPGNAPTAMHRSMKFQCSLEPIWFGIQTFAARACCPVVSVLA